MFKHIYSGALSWYIYQRYFIKKEKSWKSRVNAISAHNLFSKTYSTKESDPVPVFFTYDGLGDQLLLIAAAKLYFQTTGYRLVVAGTRPELFLEEEGIIFFDLASSRFLEKFASKTCSSLLPFKGWNFELNFISGALFSNRQGKTHIGWSKTHILENCLAKLGLSGVIDLDSVELSLGESLPRPKYSNYICIISGGAMPYKTIPHNLAQEVVEKLIENYTIIQIGLKSDPPLQNCIDLREKISIPELAQLLRNAKAYIGPIGGLMHLARFVRCPSVVLLTGEPESFIGYTQNINLHSCFPCHLCSDLVINPIHDTCPHNFSCIKRGFTANQIIEAVHKLQKSRLPQLVQIPKPPLRTPGISELLAEFNH